MPMIPLNKTLSLRPYLETITEHCQGLTKEELLDVIIGIAQDIPQNQRAEFLNKFPRLSKQTVSSKTSSRDWLTQILDLKAEVQARMKSVEDGSYYDENDAWDEYNDEGPPSLTEEMKTELESYFREVDKIFWRGHFSEAKDLYHALLNFMEESEDPFFGSGAIDYYVDIDCREVRARYCRCLAETQNEPKKLAKEMIKAMNLQASVQPYRLELSEEKYPMLRDVMATKQGDLPNWDLFLNEWKNLLKQHDTDRSYLLLMEVTTMTEGSEGLASLAKRLGEKQPRGYLYWIQELRKRSDWKTTISACQEALQSISQNTFKVQVAEYLIEAAQTIDDKKMILTGRREKFFASLSRTDLVDCLAEASDQKARDSEIKIILEHLLNLKEQKTLQTLILILSGKLDEAFERIKNSKAIGWSDGKSGTGILFGSLLTVLTKGADNAQVIKTVLQRYADQDSRDDRPDLMEKHKNGFGVTREIKKSLQEISATPRQQEKWLSWTTGIAERRIDHILTNKHRRAYGRAAEVLGALAEYYVIQNDPSKAAALLREHRDKKYNRFPAFKQELRDVLGSSKVLKNLA